MARTSLPIALASAASLGAQALMGVAMLRFFTPTAAGTFAVISQIAFFWVTLSLAQSPLKFLADAHLPPRQALLSALRSSLSRWVVLLPIAYCAVWLSALPHAGTSMAWVASLALLQLGWYLAQPWALRTAPPAAAAWARATPPLLALVLVVALGLLWPASEGNGLLVAAACGYAAGSLWLASARASTESHSPAPAPVPPVQQADRRSTALRLAHTVADATAGTAVILLWQRAHGTAEASYLAILLRLLGILPALVHAAWAQVLLAQARPSRARSVWVGLGGALATAVIGLLGAALLDGPWFAPSWRGMLPYIAPLVLWQASACVFAALSHRPFQQGQESRYSQWSIAFDVLQLLVLAAPLLLGWPLPATTHAWWLAGTCALGLIALSGWMAGIKLK